MLCLGGRRISVRIDGEGFKTRHAKEQALSRQSTSDSSRGHKPSSNGSSSNYSSGGQNGGSGSGRDYNQVVKTSSLLDLFAVTADPQAAALKQMAAQLNVEGPITSRVFVASLDYKVDERKLKEVFALAGNLVHCELFRDRDGKSRGKALWIWVFLGEFGHRADCWI